MGNECCYGLCPWGNRGFHPLPEVKNSDDRSEVKNSDDRSMVTPTSKLEKRLKKLSDGDIPIVLLTTGSLSPIHKGHVKNMELAKKRLESVRGRKIKVLCGYISPSHDSWLRGKQYGFFPVANRIAMVKLATENSDWIHCDSYEGTVEKVMDFPEVINRLRGFLKQYQNDTHRDIDVYYICGADHAEKCRLWGRPNYVVIGRANTWVPENRKCLYIENNEKNISSTEIRNAIIQGKLREVRDLLHPKVFDYLDATKPALWT